VSKGIERSKQGAIVVVIGLLLVAAMVSLTLWLDGKGESGPALSPLVDAQGEPVVVEIHRSPFCDCCGAYAEYLERRGVVVREVIHEDMTAFKDELGLPQELASCHTSLVAGYFVEGHVPIEAIAALLETAPSIDGIALPGMPSGSPGMGGTKHEPFILYSVIGGHITEFGRY
jgi:hypothetical protein